MASLVLNNRALTGLVHSLLVNDYKLPFFFSVFLHNRTIFLTSCLFLFFLRKNFQKRVYLKEEMAPTGAELAP